MDALRLQADEEGLRKLAEEALKRAAAERPQQSAARPAEPTVVTRPPAGATRTPGEVPAFGPLEQNTTFRRATTVRFFGVTDLAQCQSACAAEQRCVAYTFVKRGAYSSNPDNAVCYLSSAIGGRVTDSCCVSAARAGLETSPREVPPPVAVPPHRVVQTINEGESRDASGRITVEASTIHVTECNPEGSGRRMVYIYEYVNRRGFRAIRPPDWGHALGGRDFDTRDEATATACGSG
jgi:hypothetical protein